MKSNKGKFIVLEGTDGSGKGTQLNLLANRLETESGLSVARFDFPQYESAFFGELAGRFLSGEFGQLDEVDPHLAALLFAGDRWQAAPHIYKTLDSGKIVLANRYVLSNMAHQGAKVPEDRRDDFFDYLETLEFKVYGIPQEDLNIILRVAPEVGQELVGRKEERQYLEGGKKDIQEEDIDHLREASRVYGGLDERFPGKIRMIDCCKKDGEILPIDEIHEMVWSETTAFLHKEPREGGITRERQG